ncbi:hypothetical protein MNBD_GAMMA20-994 [hydrothermal vent metagenome]|uniref:SPOR domain-containing protein n=1 Tax=hydrothermal vent metagenome TaxID=652676 RepID=A0A3B1AWL9_9ZZZZ
MHIQGTTLDVKESCTQRPQSIIRKILNLPQIMQLTAIRHSMRFLSLFLLLGLFLAYLPFSLSAADDEALPTEEENCGYTEIDEEDDGDDDDLPLNVIEDHYETGRMAFLFGQYAVAYKAWLPLADTGYAKAQASIGWMFHTGNGVKKDLQTAAVWYRKAADQGHEIAQNNLGVFYEKGVVGPANTKKAAIWYQMAADQGYSYAQYNLGILYAEGRGVAKDIEQAKYWLRIASRHKVKQAIAALGKLNVDIPVGETEKPPPRIAHAPHHSTPVTQGITWIKEQDPTHFTIQLARSKDLPWILRLAASGDVTKTLIHFQAKNKKGVKWHHLIYGSFPSQTAATSAIKKLPAPMQKWTPWIRPLSEIQKQLNL